MSDLPEGVADRIHVSVFVNLDWLDRIKATLFGHVYVEVETDCEISPGKVHSESIATVPTPRWPWRKRTTGYEVISE